MTPKELQQFLLDKRLSQREFAEIIGVNEQTVKSWVIGSRHINKTNARLFKLFKNYPKTMEVFSG